MTTRSMPRGAVLVAALLLTIPAAVRAADPGAPFKVRVDLGFFAGIQHYSMSDINDGIEAANAALESNSSIAMTGFKLDPYHRGTGLGVGVRVWPRERLRITADYTRLSGASTADVPLNSQPGAPALKGRVGVPAQELGITAAYFFYEPLRKLRVGAGAGAAVYLCNGVYEFSFPTYHSRVELRGTGLGVTGMLLGDYRISNIVGLEAAIGYRHAKSKDLQNRGAIVYNEDGSKSQADYSGIVTRLGIDIPFGPVK